MKAPEVARASAAAMRIAAAQGLTVDDVTVLHNSNRIAVRLLPCDLLARVAPISLKATAQFEVELAQRHAAAADPVAGLDPRVKPHAFEHDGFVITLWRYHEPVTPEISPTNYAHALERLHHSMRNLDFNAPHFTDRVAEAQRIVKNRELTSTRAEADRELLSYTLRTQRQAIADRCPAEQLLHGEPHPGNVLNTSQGPLFIDLETCCVGPIEFDLAHVPEAVSMRYDGADQALLHDCQILVLAMVAAWRWHPADEFPDGHRAERALLKALRDGAPYPTLDNIMSE